MWDAIWINAHLVTMIEKDNYGVIKNGSIGIKDGIICWLGKMSELSDIPANLATDVFDAEQHFLLPGLIDCHTHLIYAGDRSDEFEQRLNGVSYTEIAKAGGGILSTVTAIREIDEEMLFRMSSHRLQQMMRKGVTGFEIKSGYGLDSKSEAKMLRVATRLGVEFGVKVQRTFLGAHALPPEFKGQADEYITLVVNEMMPELVKEGLIDCVDVFCEGIGFSKEQTERVLQKAQELGLPIKLHAEQLSNIGGTELAAQYQALSSDHLEYIDEEGVKAMADVGMVATLLPGAFYYLRETQKPPIDLFRQYKVPMALATDCNPGSSPITSLPLIMNMACTLFQMTPLEALAGVTRNAAQALGWQNERGALEVGKRADLALFNISSPAEISYMIGSDACTGIVKQRPYDIL